ncbi:hypothetical protein LHYA1_G002931 [Lachnellula hyalina]|uniref:Up-regulated during septation protein 1 domain-containing protein n=1 Tax=Lachnellula hyalina TaxID=1316788 RepID=A0A8H8R7V5_9HELO|nr:uncharacterized protein LHYA1_G002931 [Lachnellula hyalina]TVY29226.1 hypothetical protein LHYA1_G002931 [Lachnellula hyalina]
MAHIADFMVDTGNALGLNNFIARELSPSPSHDSPKDITPSDDKEKYIWRMHQPSEPRKYQLFPQKDKTSVAAGRRSPEGRKSPESDKTSIPSQSAGQNVTVEKDRSILGSALRLKGKGEQSLIRRRKVSVPELGPMTTVQEVAMDSPTIPGRPPLHERSISAPGNSWRQHVFGESMLLCISGPALDENAELAISDIGKTQGRRNRADSSSPKPRPLSPRSLAPLIIPSTSSPQPQQRFIKQISNTRLRSESTPPEVPPKSARMKEIYSHGRSSPFTPMSSTTSLSTAPTSVSNTPLSTIPSTGSNATTPTSSALEGRSSPKPWTGPVIAPSPMGHSRGQSESTQRSAFTMGHRRGESEASIMDRGRPKKREDGSPLKRKLSKRSASIEQQAFELLPSGHRPTDILSALPASEIETIRKQAMGQASRFEVLNSKDVESLSRELRGLDERCEYLRKTHRSLRSGRRNLHERICTYLRSPRVARFSHESMLKQEEALSELDTSIDDWVSKLEQADNRRTRVRQKLLEHVAAALIMQSEQPQQQQAETQVSAVVANGENTPPRSPVKMHSPERLAEEVGVSSPESICSRRGDVESIRIYADSDVYALLADVEEEINRMGDQVESDKKEQQQQQQQENALENEKEKEMEKEEDPQKEKREENAISAGITLSAVAFSGFPSTRH